MFTCMRVSPLASAAFGSRVSMLTARTPLVSAIRRYAHNAPQTDKEAGALAVEVDREQIQKHAKEFTHETEGVPSVKYDDNDYNLAHPISNECKALKLFFDCNHIWKNEYVWQVKNTHMSPKGTIDKLAAFTIDCIRFNFDWMSGWMFGKPTVKKALTRIVFLETVAGVPGSIAATLRHLASLRRIRRDNGWIHTLLEEAENERMHLLTYITIRQPGPFMRLMVFLSQGIFFNFFFAAYLVSPRFCHRLVGYLEEQAVLTYTHILHAIDNDVGDLGKWKTTPAPEIAKKYWRLPENATLRDVVGVTRADEAHHRDVNHAFGSLQSSDPNPFKPGF